MNGFINLVRELLCEGGLPKAHVYCEKYIELPGWYRPEKKWDLLIVSDGKLLAGIEFKSQVGSFGNNYNNRTEEAIGSAVDVWAAYREGAFKPSARPWLGYLMLLRRSVVFFLTPPSVFLHRPAAPQPSLRTVVPAYPACYREP